MTRIYIYKGDEKNYIALKDTYLSSEVFIGEDEADFILSKFTEAVKELKEINKKGEK